MTLFLLVGFGIWLTDVWHGLHPAFGTMVVVLLAFLPWVGVLSADALGEVDVSLTFFIAGIFAIADGFVTTGLAERTTEGLLGALPRPESLVVTLVLVFAVTLVAILFIEGAAVTSILTSILLSSFPGIGVPVVMAEALALGTYFFAYRSAVLVAILGGGAVDTRQLVVLVSACSIASTLLLVPIQLGPLSLVF